jgi:hypothetical protein
MYVDTNGIGFEFKLKAAIDVFCDPTIRAYGTFKLGASPQSGTAYVIAASHRGRSLREPSGTASPRTGDESCRASALACAHRRCQPTAR